MGEAIVLAIFLAVYAGMIFGGIRGLALDRTGVVVLGAIALIAFEQVTPEAAWKSVDVPTMALLFGLMVVSAQFRLGGFYTAVTRRLDAAPHTPRVFLAQVMALAAVLSAILANDIVCLAVTPVLIEICSRRRLNPMPFLIGLACASNIGSAATLIGNPQNMLIGQVKQLDFLGYLLDAAVPTVLGLGYAWAVIVWMYRAGWERDFTVDSGQGVEFNAWQTAKAIGVTLVLMVVFIGGWVPRELAALAAAGILLLSRRMASPKMLGLVDWNLLLLFFGLFVVNHALSDSGLLARGVQSLAGAGVDLANGAILFVTTVVLSNLVSNVPATMLLLPASPHPEAGVILALASTLAGNMFLVGSIANIIVAEQSEKLGVAFPVWEHARAGIPVTLGTLAIAGAWLWVWV